VCRAFLFGRIRQGESRSSAHGGERPSFHEVAKLRSFRTQILYTFCGKLIDKIPDDRILLIGHLRHRQLLNTSPELVFPTLREIPMTARQTQSAPGDVGYGKPPRHTQFRKGQSGNPGGRPRREQVERLKALTLQEAYRGSSSSETMASRCRHWPSRRSCAARSSLP
jgi:hypothetical protein